MGELWWALVPGIPRENLMIFGADLTKSCNCSVMARMCNSKFPPFHGHPLFNQDTIKPYVSRHGWSNCGGAILSTKARKLLITPNIPNFALLIARCVLCVHKHSRESI